MKAVGCVSTGNMAASTSAYAARAGIRCVIFVPTFITAEKVTQTLAYGARLISVKDLPYDQMYDQSHRIGEREDIYMINSNSPLRVEGQKTFSYELCEDLDWAVPDWIVVPTSSGGNFYAIWKGFKEFRQAGLIEKLPKLLLAQSEGCAPIATAFRQRRDRVEPFPNPQTIATALMNPKPPGGDRALRALRESSGLAATASDHEILEASRELASKEGIFCEPAAATGYAVLKNMIEEGAIEPEEKIVLDVTGVGFKDMKAAEKIAGKVETVDRLDDLTL
jgi:threonine synthase